MLLGLPFSAVLGHAQFGSLPVGDNGGSVPGLPDCRVKLDNPAMTTIGEGVPPDPRLTFGETGLATILARRPADHSAIDHWGGPIGAIKGGGQQAWPAGRPNFTLPAPPLRRRLTMDGNAGAPPPSGETGGATF